MRCGLKLRKRWKEAGCFERNGEIESQRNSNKEIIRQDDAQPAAPLSGIKSVPMRNVQRCVNGRKDSAERRTLTSTSMLTFFLLFPFALVEACDRVVTVKSSEIDPPSFWVREAQEVCVEDQDGGRMSLYFTGFVSKPRYELEYYTADYNVSLFAESKECIRDSKNVCGSEMKSCSPEEVGKLTDQLITRYQCSYVCNTFDRDCALTTKATRVGPLHGMYGKIMELKEVKLNMKGSNFSDQRTLSDSDSYDLNFSKFNLRGANSTLLAIVDWRPDSSTSKSLMRYDGKFYYANSTELGRTENEQLGDYQVSLDGERVLTYAKPKVACQSLGNCSCDCSVRQRSAVSSFASRKGDFEQPGRVVKVKNDASVVEVFEPDEGGEVLVQLGNPVVGLPKNRGKAERRLGEKRKTTVKNRENSGETKKEEGLSPPVGAFIPPPEGGTLPFGARLLPTTSSPPLPAPRNETLSSTEPTVSGTPFPPTKAPEDPETGSSNLTPPTLPFSTTSTTTPTVTTTTTAATTPRNAIETITSNTPTVTNATTPTAKPSPAVKIIPPVRNTTTSTTTTTTLPPTIPSTRPTPPKRKYLEQPRFYDALAKVFFVAILGMYVAVASFFLFASL